MRVFAGLKIYNASKANPTELGNRLSAIGPSRAVIDFSFDPTIIEAGSNDAC